MLASLLARYDRRSLFAWAALLVLYAVVLVIWHDLIDWTLGMDFLLGGIWGFMTMALAWDIRPRRDLSMIGVAFFGGLVIEWWGTTTNIWYYYTAERPPLWILPAWPVAALAIDRIARVLGEFADASKRDFRIVFRWAWLALPVFVLAMMNFSWRGLDQRSTWVIFALMLGVLGTVQNARQDVLVFGSGSFLGIFLEYWGTSRYCWTYYTAEVPPTVAMVAHGFASVAFIRGLAAVEGVRSRLP